MNKYPVILPVLFFLSSFFLKKLIFSEGFLKEQEKYRQTPRTIVHFFYIWSTGLILTTCGNRKTPYSYSVLGAYNRALAACSTPTLVKAFSKVLFLLVIFV